MGETSADGSIDGAIAISALISGIRLFTVAPLRLNPQCPQNLASDNTLAPQLGHGIFLTIGNGVKQASQFTAPSGFAWVQLGQIIIRAT
jgi:hypothetical protein